MSINKEEKKAVVEEIKSKIKDASSVVLVDYRGLTVGEDTELRADFRKADVDYKIYKNRLAKIAFNELGYADFDSFLEGPTSFAFGGNDSTAPARILFEGIKKYQKMQAKCGLMDGGFTDAKAIEQIAHLPSREVLLSRMLGSMLAPLSGLARVLAAIAEQKEGAQA